MADKVNLRELSWLATERDEELRKQRMQVGWPKHVAPFSTLVAAMGNYWHPGCFEAVKAMCAETASEGYSVTFYEQSDCCYQPYDGMGIMRNTAYMRAIREGYEYILYVDNDVLPEKDALTRLLHDFVPIVSPLIRFSDGQTHGLQMPTMEAGKGLAMGNNVVLSMVLFQTSVFNPWVLGGFWESPLGADEGYHFMKLLQTGHKPFVDTNTIVTVVSPPHFPLDKSLDRTVKDLNNFPNKPASELYDKSSAGMYPSD